MKKKINPVNTEQKTTTQLWLGVCLAIFGVILIIASFLCPPMGVLDASVLAVVGEIFTFSGGLIGIDYTYKYKRYRTFEEYHHNNDLNEEENESTGEENIQ